MTIVAAPFTFGLSLLLLLLGHVVLMLRIRSHARRRGLSPADAGLYARFTTLGKVPQALGQLKYWTSRLLGRRTQIIEYKTASAAG